MSNLFPCVSFLDSESEKEIRNLQKKIFEISGAKASLEEWRPHITTGKGLDYENNIPDDLINKLTVFSTNQSPFEIKLENFGYMENWKGSKLFKCEPYVAYIDVVTNDKLQKFINNLDKILIEYNYAYDIFPYNPHLTLAFKDLDKTGFEKTKNFLSTQKFSKIVTIDSFSIVNDPKKEFVFEEIEKFEF